MAYFRREVPFIYNLRTQKIGNLLPLHSSGREKRYSNWQKIFNQFSIFHTQMKEDIGRYLNNSFVESYDHDSLDVFYYARIPAEIEEVETIEKNSNSSYTTLNKSRYSQMGDWWYSTIPDTVLTKDIRENSAKILVNEQSIAPFLDFSSVTDFSNPSSFYLKITGPEDSQWSRNELNKPNLPTIAIVEGELSSGHIHQEVFFFQFESTQPSAYTWKRINRIYFKYWDSRLIVWLGNYIPVTTQFIPGSLITIQELNSPSKQIYWSLNEDLDNAVDILTMAPVSQAVFDAGLRGTDLIKSYVLYQNEETPCEEIISILPSKKDDFLYAFDGTNINIYLQHEEFPSIVATADQLQSQSPVVKISMTSIGQGLFSLKGEYDTLYPDKVITGYRIKYITEDETLYWSSGDNWTSDDSFIDYPLKNTYGFLSPKVSFNNNGYFLKDFVIVWETALATGVTESDTFVYEKEIKIPVLSQDVSEVDFSSNVSLSYSSDGFLMLTDETSGKQKELKFIHSEYFIDPSTRTIVFQKDPSLIRVTGIDKSGNNISIDNVATMPFNYESQIDAIGALVGLERKLGESSYAFAKRMRPTHISAPNSTYSGIVAGLSREMGLEIKPVLKISHERDFTIKIKRNLIEVTISDYTAYYDGLANGEIPGYEITGTIEDLKEWLAYLDFDVTVLNQEYMTSYPIRSLLNYSNEKWITEQVSFIEKRKTLHIPPGYKIIPDSINISNAIKLSDLNAISAVKYTAYFASEDGSVVFNKDNVGPRKISYKIREIAPVLWGSPIVVADVFDYYNDNISSNGINSLMQTIIYDIENKYPVRWSD